MPDPEAADPGVYRIPGGEFYLNRCAALLNMYLMASYGEGQYVEAPPHPPTRGDSEVLWGDPRGTHHEI